MQQEHLALSTIPTQPAAENDYDAICTAIMGSARGRWFLDEYARRNRSADTALVLAAIQRIETTIRDTNEREAHQGIRLDLLEMARTIAATRAEVAGIEPEGRDQGRPADHDAPTANSGVLAMAERIQDVAWTMRERGLDPASCDQIEALATAILSASALRDPNDHRTRKLGEVLQYLELRITRILDAGATPSGYVRNNSEKGEEDDAELEDAEARHACEDQPDPLPSPTSTSRAAELELEPLVVIPFPVRDVVVDAAPVELELDPIVINLPLPADAAAAASPAVEEIDTVAAIEEELFVPATADALAAAAMGALSPAAPIAAPVGQALSGARPTPQSVPNDPLAALKAMTYEERIALFS